MVTSMLALVFLWLGGRQDPCETCHGAERLPCPEHRSADLALESNALLCSFYAGCARCGGTGRVDCPDCSPPAGATPDSSRTELAARFRSYDDAAGRPVLAVAGRHATVVCDLEPMKADRKKRSRHELAHLYLQRVEVVHAAYLGVFGLKEEDVTARSEIFLWATREDHERVGKVFCGYTTNDPEYMRGLEAITSLWLDPKKMEGDEALYHNVVHHVVHGIMNVQPPVAWTGKLHMGWADEGLSLWFEDRVLGTTTGYCFWLEELPRPLRDGRWRPFVRKLVSDGEPLDFERFLALDTVDMKREEQALGFALLDFLAERDRALLNRLLASLRAHTPARDAFKEVYGLALDELEREWRAWVERTYPKR